MFVIASISAYNLFRKRHPEFFASSFKIALTVSVLVAPLQIWLGDSSGVSVFETQPANGAAIEGHWHTYAPGTGASWSLLAWPDKQAQRNDWSLEIPGMLSILDTHSLHGQVKGLTDFRPEDQPPMIPLLYYAFQAMAGVGFCFMLLAFWTAYALRKARGSLDALLAQRKLPLAWVLCIPLPYVTVEAVDRARSRPSAVGRLRSVANKPGCVDGCAFVYHVEHGQHRTIAWRDKRCFHHRHGDRCGSRICAARFHLRCEKDGRYDRAMGASSRTVERDVDSRRCRLADGRDMVFQRCRSGALVATRRDARVGGARYRCDSLVCIRYGVALFWLVSGTVPGRSDAFRHIVRGACCQPFPGFRSREAEHSASCFGLAFMLARIGMVFPVMIGYNLY
jgi:hypothetical protein